MKRLAFYFAASVVVSFLGASVRAASLAELEPVINQVIATQMANDSEQQVAAQFADHADHLEMTLTNLKSEGVELTPETEKQLAQLIDQLRTPKPRPGLVKRVFGAIGRFFAGAAKFSVRGLAFIGNVAFDVVATPLFFAFGITQGLGVELAGDESLLGKIAFAIIEIGAEVTTLAFFPGFVSYAVLPVGFGSKALTLLKCLGSARFENGVGHENFCGAVDKLDSIFYKSFSTPGRYLGVGVKTAARAVASLFKSKKPSDSAISYSAYPYNDPLMGVFYGHKPETP